MTATEPTAPHPGKPERMGSNLRKTAVAGIRYLLLSLVVIAAGYALAVNWGPVSATLASLQIQRVIPSFLALLGGIGAATMSWQVLVDDFGTPIGVGRGAQIFLVGQLGKYLPGSVWAYLLQIELGSKAGLARARVFAASFFSIGVALVAALLTGALALTELISRNPSLQALAWLYLLLPVGLIMLHPKVLTRLVLIGFRILRRPRLDHPVSGLTVAKSLGWAVLSYVSYGVHLWLLADTRTGLSIGPLALSIGTMGIALISGLFAFFLPSGVGARELVIVTAITPLVGVGPAIAYAAVSRLLFTVADLASAGVAALLGVLARRRRGQYHGDPGID